MSGFIEEFYYGNIDPQARSFEKNKTVQRSMQILSDNEEYLTKELEGESLQKFLDLVNAWSVVNGESNLEYSGRREQAVRAVRATVPFFESHPFRRLEPPV